MRINKGWWKRPLLGTGAMILAAAVWLPNLHRFYTGRTGAYFSETSIAPRARMLVERHLRLWAEPDLRRIEIDRMRATNAEWDFMGRSFLVWSLANLALRDPASTDECLAVMDRIIDETMAIEEEQGCRFFLMPYGQTGKFVHDPQRSHFVDGEIALMLASRRLVREREAYKRPLAERVDLMVERMKKSRVMCAESYPNECWLFCNAVALAAIRVSDHLDGTDHSAFFREWIETAKARLVDRETGLLISSFDVEGIPNDGPEGSSIWMAAHCLQLIDEQFAADQYTRARKALARKVLGFGYAREWPASWHGPMDVDSGPVIPGLGVSASSSGLAFVAARSFGDGELLSSLLATLRLAAFPVERNGALRFAASNQVGDAVILYATVLGPVWDRVKQGRRP